MKFSKKEKGFTLIELLVVVAIIGVLASIVLSSLGEARDRAKTAKKLAIVNQLEKALELYHLDNNQYPAAGGSWGVNNNGTTANSVLATALAPYITLDFNDPDQFTQLSSSSGFMYRSHSANNYQSYGLRLSGFANYGDIAANDGGYSSSEYEPGALPGYCVNKYTGTDAAWYGHGSTTLCAGGN